MERFTKDETLGLLRAYTPFIKDDGNIIMITPQEAGYASDPTHVTMMNHGRVLKISKEFCDSSIKQYSVPFPNIVGKVFKYNQNISIRKILKR